MDVNFELDFADLELLDFGFPEVGDTDSIYTGPALTSEYGQMRLTKKVVKGASKKNGGKTKSLPRKVFKKGMTVAEAITAHGSMLNMSRRPPTNVLVAFPVFDKCDSLVYFPHSYARHLNCGDVASTSKLIFDHADKDCLIMYRCGDETCSFALSLKYLVTLLQISEDLEPDRIMCVHSTKVIDNQIRSQVYMKFTDSQTLYTMVCSLSDIPEVSTFSKRANRFRLYANQPDLDETVKNQVLQHAQVDDDVLVYMRMDLILTFDDKKKITCIETNYHLTSVHPTPGSVSNRIEQIVGEVR